MDVLNNLDLLRDLTGAMNSSHLPVEALTAYLRKGGDPNTHYVMSLLSQACYVGHLEMVKVLLDAGAKPNFAGKSGKLPLYVAAKNQKPGNLEIVELLIAKGADVNCKHVTGSTPLLEAVLANDEIKTAMLIKAGANIFDSNNGGETGLHISAMKGNVKIMKMFINAGVPANALKRHGPASSLYTGTQPLHLTVVGPNGGHAEAATLLLNSGANVDATEWNGRTTLHLAAIRNAYRVVDVLIAHGCGLDPISLDNDEQKTPLMKAIDLGHHVIVEKLIAAGVRLDTTDHYGTTPLVTAVFTGKPLVVQLLLRAGCNVNLAIPNGATPFRASLRHAPCITEMLVLAGCRVPRDFSSNITGPFPLANYPSLLEWLIWYSFNPPSLQFCCRSLIRNALGFRPAEKLDWLSPSPIPFRVKEFLLCDDLDDVIDRYSDTTKESPQVDSS